MNQDQLDVLNITQEVLRRLLLAMGTMNPQAMPRVALALRAASADGRSSPMASQMLADLAEGAEMFSGERASGGH